MHKRSIIGALVAAMAALHVSGPDLLRLEVTERALWVAAGWVLAPAAASLLCIRAALRTTGADKKAWHFLGVGCAAWAAGAMFWAINEVLGTAQSFPALPDAGYLLGCLFFVPGIYHHTVASTALSRLQISNLVMVLTGVALTVFLLLLHVIDASTLSPWGSAVALTYSGAWLGTFAFGLLGLFFYAPRAKRFVFCLLLIGVGMQALANTFYAISMLDLGYEVGSFYDSLWVISFVFVAWSAAEDIVRHRTPALTALAGEPALVAGLDTALPAFAVGIVSVAACTSGWLIGGEAALAAVPVAIVFAASLGIRAHCSVTVERDLRQKAEASAQELEGSRKQLSAVLESTTDSVVVLDREWRVSYFNERARQVLHTWPALSIGSRILDAYPEEIAKGFYQRYRKAMDENRPVAFEEYLETEQVWLEVHAYPSADGISIFFRDVSDQRKVRQEIIHLAHHDQLTRLANRASFYAKLALALGDQQRVSLFCIDLDYFKEVNDGFGHPAGDALLIQAAGRLRESARPGDLVARLGGDEFAVICLALGPDQEVALAERLIAALNQPYFIDSQPIKVGASLGIAQSPQVSIEPDLLFKRADIALYAAKEAGRTTFRFFEPEMEMRFLDKQRLKGDLAIALEKGQLQVVYQPIVDLRTNQIEGFEALLRWNHPNRGAVSPAEFIPIAEEAGLIGSIGAWVLDQACRDLGAWPPRLSVSVNLSPYQFRQASLYSDVAQVLTRTQVNPSRLVLEVTETVLLRDTATNVEVMRGLRALGVRIALDDFGTGYSSLSYLKSFPFDKIKIDRSFISEIEESSEACAIVEAVTSLGKSLGITITAEGVENRQQLDRIRQRGCDEAQGFFFSRPVPADQVLATLERLDEAAMWWSDAPRRA